MQVALAVLVIVGLLLVVAWSKKPQSVAWAEGMRRLQPGRRGHAEWMAADTIVDQVQHAYLEAWEWADAAQMDWNRWRSEMDRFFGGSFLGLQRARLEALSAARGIQLAGAVSARHSLTVRAFSSDGLACLLVDHQTQRQIATFWTKTRAIAAHQPLEDRTMVFRMAYDRAGKRWRIDELIQEFPAGWSSEPPTHGRVRLSGWPAEGGPDHRPAN